MKKILLLAIATSTLLMAGTLLTPEKLTEIKKSTTSLQNPALKIIKGEDLGSVYFLRILAEGSKGTTKIIEGFVDKKTKAVYLGGGYHQNGKKITFPTDPKVVEDAVILTYGTGSKELYMITDPQCPYCTKFMKESKGKLSEYTVKVILFKLPGSDKSTSMIDYILSAKDNTKRVHRYNELMTGGDISYREAKVDNDRISKYLRKSSLAGSDLEIKGTPSFYIKKNGKFKTIGWSDLVK